VLKDLEEKGPRNCIESFSYVNLEQNDRRLPSMDGLARKLNVPEVVMYSSALNERALIAYDEAIKYAGQPLS
jgi:hypothetical protein